MGYRKGWFASLRFTDRRKAQRRPALNVIAYYWDGGPPTPRRVRDISSVGMYLLTEQRWYPNTLISMTLMRTDETKTASARSVQVTGRVVRAGNDGVGFAFVPPPAAKPGRQAGAAGARDLMQFLAGLWEESAKGKR